MAAVGVVLGTAGLESSPQVTARVVTDFYTDGQRSMGATNLFDPTGWEAYAAAQADRTQPAAVLAAQSEPPAGTTLRQHPALQATVTLTEGADWAAVVRALADQTGLLVMSDEPHDPTGGASARVPVAVEWPLWRALDYLGRVFEVGWHLDEDGLTFRSLYWFLNDPADTPSEEQAAEPAPRPGTEPPR